MNMSSVELSRPRASTNHFLALSYLLSYATSSTAVIRLFLTPLIKVASFRKGS